MLPVRWVGEGDRLRLPPACFATPFAAPLSDSTPLQFPPMVAASLDDVCRAWV